MGWLIVDVNWARLGNQDLVKHQVWCSCVDIFFRGDSFGLSRLWVKQIILHNVSNLLKASIQHRLTSFEQEEILPVSDLWTWTTVLSLGLQSTSLTCRFWIYHGSTTVRWFLKINLSLYTHTHTHTHLYTSLALFLWIILTVLNIKLPLFRLLCGFCLLIWILTNTPLFSPELRIHSATIQHLYLGCLTGMPNLEPKVSSWCSSCKVVCLTLFPIAAKDNSIFSEAFPG